MTLTPALPRENQDRDVLLLAAQLELLAGVVAGEALPQALESLLRVVERVSSGGLLASILLVDETGRYLLHGAAPSLPADYSAAIHGAEIGPSVGSCGTAAYRRSRVIVEDIDSDPLWADFRELALGAGLQACWSTPVVGADHQRWKVPRAGKGREVRVHIEVDHQHRGDPLAVQPVEVVRGPGQDTCGRVPLARGGPDDGAQLAHQRRRLDVVTLHVSDDEDQSVLDGDRVEPVATHVHARVAGPVLRSQLHRPDPRGDVRKQAALEAEADGALLGKLALALLVEPAALDRRGHRADQDLDEGQIAPVGAGRLRVVHREGTQHPATGAQDGGRPTSLQARP